MFDPNIALPEASVIGPRMPYLVELARGKKVLHIGCVDAMITESRLASGEHLHGRLEAVANKLVGIDIDASGIELLAARGHGHLEVVDVTEKGWHQTFRDDDFDLLLASEVVEHLSNPGIFLDEARLLAIATESILVVTVPNAFRVVTLRRLRQRIEYVHPDHNFWFSYHTITNLLKKHSWEIVDFDLYGEPRRLHPSFDLQKGASKTPGNPQKKSVSSRVAGYVRGFPDRLTAYFLLGRSPYHADGLIIKAKPTRV